MSAYSTNRKAHFSYEILDRYETGIELLGYEVKSIRLGKANLDASHVIVRGDEAFVVGLRIEPYQQVQEALDPIRTRKLLLKKKEIAEIARGHEKERLTIIPLSLYNKGRKIKLEIALAIGKKSHDKRETLKKRAVDRDLRREYKVR